MGNPPRFDEIVFLKVNKGMWFWRKHVYHDLSLYKRFAHIVVKKGKRKKSNKEKLALG